MGVVPAGDGEDFFRYVPRELNDRADALTHLAREEGTRAELPRWTERPTTLRGQWDGGKDATGAAQGWWLQRDGPPAWKEAGWQAEALDPASTVTQCELKAAVSLLRP